MTTDADLVIAGGRVIDAASGLDAVADVAVTDESITAIGKGLIGRRTIDARGCVVTAGLVDLHTHVFRHGADFCLDADECGVRSGVTTAVDMGSSGAWTFPAFKHYVIDAATTNLVGFINVTMIGSAGGNRRGPDAFLPQMCGPEAIAAMHARHPDKLRGIKTYVESGGVSRVGRGFLDKALEAAELTGLPLYIHTGELLAVDESNRPAPESVMPIVLSAARPGDLLGHAFSGRPDGVLGTDEKPSAELLAALDNGVLLDIGHGLNFDFSVARRMLDAGVIPTVISSDVHGAFVGIADDSVCDWSLVGTMSKLWTLGIALPEIIAATTLRPARVLAMTDQIGTLAAGRVADITILRIVEEPWEFRDSSGHRLPTDRRLVPRHVVRNGTVIDCDSSLLRDVLH